ncbi:mycothiol system anti-sigma-R factor [Trueperella bernardiae]|uniref:mycothiol system anti-sigma-R factor n=1 Tax=Trueperella bernardiae TaxID=59561 RepID=UPI0028898270|nr:mycothiol system anti-sigma-R factor [Trueperella bernardiae]
MKEFDELMSKLEACTCHGECTCAQCGCEEVLDHLFELVDDEISDDDARRLLRHGVTCRACAARIEEEIVVRKVIRRGCCSQEAPESLRTKITRIVGE